MATETSTEGERHFRAWWDAFIETGHSGPEWAHSLDFARGWEMEKDKEIWELAARKLAAGGADPVKPRAVECGRRER